MKFKNYIMRLPALAFIAMLLCAGTFLSSCDDEEVISDDVVLESFGPSGIKHGESIKFIGRNLDKVTTIVLPNAEVAKSEFTTQTNGLIELVVPRAAKAGKVILKTPKGEITSKAMLSFEVPVIIESITAEARPGSEITIKGKMVDWIEEVVFSDGISVTEFVSASLEELVVTVPMEAQSGYLIFSSGGTEPLSFASEEELIVTLPKVTELNPAAIKHTEELTIKGTDLDLVTEVKFEGVEEPVTAFESQSATEIVIAVPASAVKGNLTLFQASPVDVVTSQELTIILPKGTALAPQPAIPGLTDITITGTNLDLVASLTLPGVAEPVAAAAFKSHSPEEIVLALPEGTKAGAVKYTTIHGYISNLGVNIVLPGEGPKPLAITLFDDEFFFGGGDWSWGSESSDPANNETAYSGSKSWKFVTDGGGGAKSGGMSGVDASDMGVFVFSLYGGPGTDGQQVAAVLGSDGNDKWDSYNAVTLVEGEWTEYRIPLSSYPTVNLQNVTIFIFKLEGASAGQYIHVDRVGFDPAGPPPPPALQKVLYDDAAKNGLGAWGGFGGTSTDFDNAEPVREGAKSIKATYVGGWGGAAQFGGGDGFQIDGHANFAFSIYGGEGTGGKQLKLLLKTDAGEKEKMIEVAEGEWKDVAIPFAELGNPEVINELFFQDADFSGDVYFDYIGVR
jgi:hypothetical protein